MRSRRFINYFLFHRSIPVPQWSTKCPPLSVNWWFSYFHDGLWSHLFSLHSLLHVSAGQSSHLKTVNNYGWFNIESEWVRVISFFICFKQGKLMKQHKWEYFRSKWNVLELAIIILSWSALCVFIKRTLLGKRDIEYYQNHKDEWVHLNVSFHWIQDVKIKDNPT